MNRYADPSRCPDCQAAITPGALACDVCALSLQGQTAQRLYTTLSEADVLLGQLRAASAPVTGPTAVLERTPSPLTPDVGRYPAPAPQTARAPRPGLSAASVPKILLSLGAGCLLVAALVFLAVAWQRLGVGGRTATLVALTAVSAGLTLRMARHALRAATESLGLVGYGLLTLDVLGADHAGWFGDLHASGLLVLLGVVLVVAGAAGALAVRRTAAGSLVAGELVAALGAGLAVLGVDLSEQLPDPVTLIGGTLLAAAVTLAMHRAELRVATIGALVVTAVAWASETVDALLRVLENDDTWRTLWSGGHPVPLLVAAALVGTLALASRLPTVIRVGALAIAQLLVIVALLAPTEGLEQTQIALVAVAVLVLASAATRLLPGPWGLTNLITLAVAALGTVGVVAELAGRSMGRLADAADPVWAGRAGDVLPATPGDPALAPWLLLLGVPALLGAAWALIGASPTASREPRRLSDLRVGAALVGAALVAVALVAVLGLYPVPVSLVVGALLVTVAGFTAWWLRTPRTATVLAAGAFVAAALVVSLHAEWLSALALAVLVVITTVVHLRDRADETAGIAGVLLATALAGSAAAWGAVADLPATWTALAGLLLLGVLVLAAPYAPARCWSCPNPSFARTGVEVGAAASALPLTLAGVALALGSEVASWTAVYLTASGVVVTVMSLLRTDRRSVGWVGGLLLAAATWVRLWDLGVHAPEAYTLPSALVLLAVGGLRLRRDPTAATLTALAPGLSLALAPSLLWVLADPTGPRTLLLGLGCLAVVLAGVRLRWTAPIAVGATVGALLVLRLAAPYIGDSVPRWVLIGGAGALLVTIGATWERRVAEARNLLGYVRALR